MDERLVRLLSRTQVKLPAELSWPTFKARTDRFVNYIDFQCKEYVVAQWLNKSILTRTISVKSTQFVGLRPSSKGNKNAVRQTDRLIHNEFYFVLWQQGSHKDNIHNQAHKKPHKFTETNIWHFVNETEQIWRWKAGVSRVRDENNTWTCVLFLRNCLQ